MRRLACPSVPCGAVGLRQRRRQPDRPGGIEEAGPGFWANEPASRRPGPAAQAHPRRYRQGRRGGDLGTARVGPLADADVRDGASNGRLCHLFVAAPAVRSSCAASQVTGTRGLGTDLLSAWTETPDPLSRPIPPASWPAGVRAQYEFPPTDRRARSSLRLPLRAGGAGGSGYPAGAPPGVEIQRDLRSARLGTSRTCTSPMPPGFVWRSLQWVGPKMDLLDLQLLLPYTGN